MAEYLVDGLKPKGFAVLEPVAEVSGWMVPIENAEFSLWIGCGNYDAYPDDGFLCFIEPHQSPIRRWLLWTVDASARMMALHEAIDQILSAHRAVRDKGA